MKKHYTTKLFYNKYIYKLSVRNELAPIFRGKNLSYVKTKIDEMQSAAEANLAIEWPGRSYRHHAKTVTLEQFVDTAILYKFINENKKDCMLRIEGYTIDIYSNERQWLKDLTKLVDTRGFYEPASVAQAEYLLENTDTEIIDGPVKWEYKVFFMDSVDPGFANFCRGNKDNIKIGKKALAEVENNGYCRGFYFYVKSEKHMMLASIASGNSFGRVVKYISSQNLDK